MAKLATVCMNCVYDKKANLDKYFMYIDKAAEEKADLVVFPEQSLQAYLPSLTVLDPESFEYQYENAELVPEGPSTQKIIAKAKERGIYVIYGMTEKSEEADHILYNTMVLVGPEGYIGKYRKVHLPLDELHVYYHGKDFPVFDTKIGKIGMLICYDKSFPESARELALGGAELLVMSTAWPIDDIQNADNLDNDQMYMLYETFDKARALENQCFFISSNQFGKCGQIDYLGCSTITNPSGKKLATTGYSEGIVYAEADIKKDIYEGKTKGFLGLNLVKDRQVYAYKRITGIE